MSENEITTRKARLAELRAAGIDPFPAESGAHDAIAQLRAAHDAKSIEQLESENNRAAVCGRVRALRSFGKLLFFTIVEEGAALQVSARKQEVEPALFAFANKLDVGDFVTISGTLWRTQKGELTVAMHSARLLAKALRPLPAKWHGLKDPEARYRQRDLDLLANPRAREIAQLRGRTVAALRATLDARNYLEVETPVLQPLYGGAAARPFTTEHLGYKQQLYLRISDELYLKRLIIGGLERVYEIAHNFRNEGVSAKHSPEFTMLECYEAYSDYRGMMDVAQALVQAAARAAGGKLQLHFGGHEINLQGEWPRLEMRAAINDACGIDILEAHNLSALQKACRGKGIDPAGAPTWAQLVDLLFSQTVEPRLIQPTFVTHHPVELSPLAKRSPDDSRLALRFELFVGGMEIANAYSELNDPQDQRARFEAQRQSSAAGDEEAHPMDEEFLLAMEHGMPPTGGLGLGVDRLVRILADAPNLREVILFPHLRESNVAAESGEGEGGGT